MPWVCPQRKKKKDKKKKRLKDLNIRQDTIKLLEANIGKTFSDINSTNIFLGQSPKAIEIKTKINRWVQNKLIGFSTAKETLKKKKMKIQPKEWEEIVATEGGNGNRA